MVHETLGPFSFCGGGDSRVTSQNATEVADLPQKLKESEVYSCLKTQLIGFLEDEPLQNILLSFVE